MGHIGGSCNDEKKCVKTLVVLLYTIMTLCQNKPMIVTYLHFSPFSHCVLRQQSQHLFSGKPQQFKSPSHWESRLHLEPRPTASVPKSCKAMKTRKMQISFIEAAIVPLSSFCLWLIWNALFCIVFILAFRGMIPEWGKSKMKVVGIIPNEILY